MHSSQAPAAVPGVPPTSVLPASGSTGTASSVRPAPVVRLRVWALVHCQDLITIGVLFIVIAVKAWERFAYPEWLGRTDIVNQYLPWWSYLGRELRAGNIPGWNPYQLSGTPFLGDPQSGWMYLPVMIPFTLFSPLTAIKVYVVVQLVIGGLSTYWFARVLRFQPLPALGASVAYVLGPFLTFNTYCCNIQAHAATWVPAGLLGIELAVRATTWRQRIAGWALSGFAVSQIFAGWMGQGAYVSLILLGSYLVYRVFTRDGRLRITPNHLKWLVVHSTMFLALSFGLGAAALLPRMEVIAETNLDMAGYVSDGGTTGGNLDLVLTRLFSPGFDQRRMTIGAATLALAMIGAIVARRRIPAPFFAIQTLVVLTLTLRPTPLHEVFYLLPRFQELHDHDPARIRAVLMIGPAILAAAALEAIPRLRLRTGILAAAIPFTGLGLILLALNPSYRTMARIGTGSIIAFAVVSLTVLAVAICTRYRANTRPGPTVLRLAPIVLILAMICEPGVRDVIWHIRTNPVDPETVEVVQANINPDDFNSAGDWLQRRLGDSTPPFRYIGYDAINLRTLANDEGVVYQNRHFSTRYRRLLIGPRSLFLELYYFQGYNPVQLRNTIALYSTINGHPLEYHDAHVMPYGMTSPWLNVMGVRFVVVPPIVAPGRPDLLHLNQRWESVFDDGRARVLENPDAYPLGWLVHETQVAPQSIALARIESGSVDASLVAILDKDAEPPALGEPGDPDRGSVAVKVYTADEIRFDVRAEAAGIVVIGEIFDPGWHAYVDGDRVEMLRVDGVLRGVPVDAGHHIVELRYEPRSINGGLGITGLTLLALIAGLVATKPRSGIDAG